jgi:hypothetical protein
MSVYERKGGMCGEAFVYYIDILFLHSPSGTQQNHEKPHSVQPVRYQDAKQVPPDSKTHVTVTAINPLRTIYISEKIDAHSGLYSPLSSADVENE